MDHKSIPMSFCMHTVVETDQEVDLIRSDWTISTRAVLIRW